ncbi:hypothetical protein ACHQM5_005859 [Ranunculus cassubicifolius]
MDRNNEATWADQWDDNVNPMAVQPKKKSSGVFSSESTAKYKQKAGEGFDKTKTLAATGFKKAKQGTIVGFHWVKDKYNQRKQNQKH